jgi:glyoxylase-like metal-dependent hydrolase (beta-lactamase superfamily II)
MSFRRVLLVSSFVLVAGLAAAYHVLFVDDPLPSASKLSIDWMRVRTLAGPVNEGPRAIRTDVVARGSFHGWMICAGCGWDAVPMEFRTYQLVYVDGRTVVLDAVHDAERHATMPMMRDYDAQAFTRQTEAIRRADRVVLTHEHWDHASGLRAVIENAAVRERLWIPQAQRDSAAMREAGLSAEELADLPATGEVAMQAIAPGVVVIPMPGHTPGSQVVYVRRVDGNEYLFLGDIVWNARNLRERRGKSRMISWVAGEAPDALLDQIAYFADLAAGSGRAPSSWRIVVAHDPEQNARLVAGGFLEEGLAIGVPTPLLPGEL